MNRGFEEYYREVVSNRVDRLPPRREPAPTSGPIGFCTSAMSPAPRPVSLVHNQTRIKNQCDRNTCWVFAAVAALEAYYKREHGLNLSLSEQFLYHVFTTSEVLNDYYTYSGYPQETKCALSDRLGSSAVIKFMEVIPLPLEQDCPYMTLAQIRQLSSTRYEIDVSSQTDMDAVEWSEAYVPRKAYLNARYRVLESENVWSKDKDYRFTLICEKLKKGFEICADFKLKSIIRDGVFDYDSDWKNQPKVGRHAMLIVGYDLNEDIFLLKNSWGGSEFTRATTLFIRKCYKSGFVILNATHPDRNDFKRQRWLGIWNFNNDGWTGKAHIRRYFQMGVDYGKPFKMGTLYLDSNSQVRDLIAVFDDDDRVRLFQGESHVRIRPGNTLPEFTFAINMFTWEPMHAGGYGVWSGMSFGVFMSKSPIVCKYGNNFNVNKWIGRWWMNNDGWHGWLTIHNHNGQSISASYEPVNSGRTVLAVWGEPGREKWQIELFIKNEMDTTKFVLFFHTWTQNLFSGYTVWEGMKFGLFGVKQA